MLATQSMSAQSSNLAVRHLPFGLIWPDFISTSGLSIATKRAFQPDGKRQMKDYQLLRDVDTRWSSTLIMIDRALLLRRVSSYFKWF